MHNVKTIIFFCGQPRRANHQSPFKIWHHRTSPERRLSFFPTHSKFVELVVSKSSDPPATFCAVLLRSSGSLVTVCVVLLRSSGSLVTVCEVLLRSSLFSVSGDLLTISTSSSLSSRSLKETLKDAEKQE